MQAVKVPTIKPIRQQEMDSELYCVTPIPKKLGYLHTISKKTTKLIKRGIFYS